MRERREVELIKLLILGSIAVISVGAAAVVVVGIPGLPPPDKELRNSALGLLRDGVLVAMSGLGIYRAYSQGQSCSRESVESNNDPEPDDSSNITGGNSNG